MLRTSLVAALGIAFGCGARTDVGRGGPRAEAGTSDAAILDVISPPLPDGARPDARACSVACDDGLVCNGAEYCEETTGRCMPGTTPDCDDGDPCTVDACNERARGCTHVSRDVDADGDGWGTCRGDCDDADPRVHPGAPERCDGRDDDCDGSVDEGVRNACGDCRPNCDLVVIGQDGDVPFDASAGTGVVVHPDGSLSLSERRVESFYAWIANHLFGTITKLDTRDGSQEAEYDAVLLGPGNHAEPPGTRCLWESRGGNCPSRTAVDLRGAVYVANRAFFAQGTVTKIAGFEDDCVDRDGNGVIDTSRDRDGDGRIERAVPGEFLGQRDECLLWTVDVGGIGGVPRAIAVAADGGVWVGLHGEQAVVELDPDDGSVRRRIALGARRFAPYGAAIDGRGRLWLTEAATGRIAAIELTTGRIERVQTAPSRVGCNGSYGIAVDGEDRVWIAGLHCPAVFRYDPASDTWLTVSLPDSGVTRGIAADERGYVWIASSHEWVRFAGGEVVFGPAIERLTRVRASDGRDVRVWGTPGAPLPGLGAIGVGLDSMGRVWLVNQQSSTATRFDPTTGEAREYPTGESPYTYSDFTGYALRTFTAPHGFLRTVIEGCAVGPTQWERLEVDATAPAGTSVEIRLRAAPTRAALETRSWIGPWRTVSADLRAPPGPVPEERFLEVEVTLVASGGARSPRVRSVTLQRNCPAG
ncbi:MAG: MopE-related protein [Myxococcales bacterium]|nr:MopE-related protein [Myxococcales bacterium]